MAIIGVLASIAIPEFAEYRAKVYNAAAHSDVKNFTLGMEAMLAENENYGVLPGGTRTDSDLSNGLVPGFKLSEGVEGFVSFSGVSGLDYYSVGAYHSKGNLTHCFHSNFGWTVLDGQSPDIEADCPT